MSPNPSVSKITWKNSPDEECWACKKCDHATQNGQLAGEHAVATGHGLPMLSSMSGHKLVTPKLATRRGVLAVRAGDYMQLGQDLKLAMEIASIAISCAQRAGAPASETGRLTKLLAQLRSD